MDKRLLKAETERDKVERELKQALINIKNTEHNMQICRKEQLDDKQRVEALLREKNAIARSRETGQERIKKLNHELLLCGQAKAKVEHELDTLTQSIDDVRKQMETVEKERDKYSLTIHGLEQQVRRLLLKGIYDKFFSSGTEIIANSRKRGGTNRR